MIVILSVLAYLLAVVAVLCLVTGVVVVGVDGLRTLRHTALPKVVEIRYPLAGLGAVLLLSAVGRQRLQILSELFGLNLTHLIYAIEGGFVAWIQLTFQSPLLTEYFSWIYIYGYVFMLVFPFIAYGTLEETTTLKRLITAYALNYAIGLVMYTIVYAHGPRNHMLVGDAVSLLYTTYPEFQVLTSEVNEHTNVFPSLHTSLAVTVALFGYLTREEYPIWWFLSAWLAVSVMISTMYLGIHWFIDVLGGIILAVGCVVMSYRFVTPSAGETTEETASVVE